MLPKKKAPSFYREPGAKLFRRFYNPKELRALASQFQNVCNGFFVIDSVHAPGFCKAHDIFCNSWNTVLRNIAFSEGHWSADLFIPGFQGSDAFFGVICPEQCSAELFIACWILFPMPGHPGRQHDGETGAMGDVEQGRTREYECVGISQEIQGNHARVATSIRQANQARPGQIVLDGR